MATKKNAALLIARPFAHRGLHDGKLIPENSLPAFENAIHQSYAIELDVHLLTDGVLAVFHDDDLRRMCNNTSRIAEQSSESIIKYRLLESDQHIPTLEEVLTLVNGAVPILIEIKNTTPVGKLEPVLSQMLEGYKGDVAIQSFNPFSLAWFARNNPKYLRGQLSGAFPDFKMNWLLKKALQYLWLNFKSKPDFIAYDLRALPASHIKQRRMKGMPVLAWTVRSEAEAKQVIPYADNIIFESFMPK